jgi:hypothetical protein
MKTDDQLVSAAWPIAVSPFMACSFIRKYRFRARPSHPRTSISLRRGIPRPAGAQPVIGRRASPLERRSWTDEFKGLIAKAATGAALSREEAARGFDTMMSGEATPSQMGVLLMALRVRGETVDEITGAVTTMRPNARSMRRPGDRRGGNRGDASGSFNISTCAAFIVAGAGVPVAKHGNRALSSRSGAADVLAALGGVARKRRTRRRG